MINLKQHTPKGTDVGCLDNRRVIVRIGTVSYIHANYVATPNHPKRFICTQAPLPKTCYEFWNMVVQERSASILMLCNFVEMTEHQYLYVHQVLLLYLNRARYLDDSVQPYLEEFTKDYLKATKGF
ncbi:Protein-tyrosine phosphatase [Teladorsagia circumcincta]|uniref:Protein-tyrosine phosphatase n=1 Tax=Teladorsagia circumcincta TaxID=45464 RepID=A0A2G9UKL6_TELCI|nr:Protein-tyrosine phosphatase [Teladorsagia circumcincta]